VGDEVVEVRPLGPSDSWRDQGHASGAGTVLAAAGSIYGRSPRGWLVTLPAVDFSFSEGRSPTAVRGAEEALELIAALIAAEAGRCTR
jgi:hypothetical protein